MERVSGKKIVVGMSGGVDSSMALVILKRQGWQPIGVSLKYPYWKDPSNCFRENVCCSTESFRIAEDVCRKLGVPYHIYDVSANFKKEVTSYFIDSLRLTRTPNPCVMCNRFLKFRELFAWAAARGIRHVATGHYARVRKNSKTGRYELLKAKDAGKDQTYSLSFLSQEQLSGVIFPLGNFTKQDVYEMAKKEGFKIFLKRKQSQDFCFVSGNALEAFLAKEIGFKPGKMLDDFGEQKASHKGLHFYTIGQRKGIGLSGGPYFVEGYNVRKNVLCITKNEKKLFCKEVLLGPCNFPGGMPRRSLRVRAKIRYRQQAAFATLFMNSANKARLVFDRPQRAVTPGQFAVCYRRNVCVAAGEIR